METSLNYTEAQNDIAFIAQRFRGILALADYLKEIESLEQFADERQKFAVYLRDFANQEQIRLDGIKASIVEFEAKAKITVETANKEASAIISKAKTDAEAIADKILSDLESSKLIKFNELNNTLGSLETAKLELANIKAQVQAATQQLQTVRTELEKLRNSI